MATADRESVCICIACVRECVCTSCHGAFVGTCLLAYVSYLGHKAFHDAVTHMCLLQPTGNRMPVRTARMTLTTRSIWDLMPGPLFMQEGVVERSLRGATGEVFVCVCPCVSLCALLFLHTSTFFSKDDFDDADDREEVLETYGESVHSFNEEEEEEEGGVSESIEFEDDDVGRKGKVMEFNFAGKRVF